MTLSAGDKLGPYEILTPIGAGGMGEVYRARDSRLGRDVAVKVSAEHFSERFERESRVIASLNHPNICTLYDVGPNYLVMELVEGPTLAERIAAGPVPLEEALMLARQIAEALEAAHEKGIIHRDLKPANVKVTPEGTVKVLDFGLAKVADPPAPTSGAPTMSPTLSLEATRAGLILGTAAYMSPEQARATPVDKRADIWAFGCVLYELVSGKRLFDGDSLTDVLAAVVRAEPNWGALPANTPAAIRRLLKRCLEKDRKRRLPDIGVARLEIDEALAVSEEPGENLPPPKQRRTMRWLAAAAVILALAGAAALWQMRRTPAQELWSGVMLGGPAGAFSPRVSPDGQLLAFLAFIDELPQVGVMKPDGGSWTMLTHDRDSGYVATVAWAPDGSKIYFDRYWGQPRGVYTVPPLGGEPRLLVEDAFGPEPLPDGSLIVAKLTGNNDDQLIHYWPDSGRMEPLPAFVESRDVAPLLRAFPDGKEIVYFGTNEKTGRTQSPRMFVMDLASGTARELAPGLKLDTTGFSPLAVSPDGGTVLALGLQEDTRLLMAIPRAGGDPPRVLLTFASSVAPSSFNLARDGSLYLDQWPALTSILRFPVEGGAPEEVSLVPGTSFAGVMPGGDLLLTSANGGKPHLMVLRPGAEPRVLLGTPEPSSGPAVELPGGRVAFVIGDRDERRIAIISARDGHVLQRFSAAAVGVESMVGTPDGGTLYYSSGGSIWAQPVSGGEPRRVTEGSDVALDPAGRNLYVKRSQNGVIELFRVAIGQDAAEKRTVPSEYHLAGKPLTPSAVDARGRILVTVLSAHSFYYRTGILDPASKTLSVIPTAFAGDVFGAVRTPDGRFAAGGARYLSSLWRYRQVKEFAKK